MHDPKSPNSAATEPQPSLKSQLDALVAEYARQNERLAEIYRQAAELGDRKLTISESMLRALDEATDFSRPTISNSAVPLPRSRS